MRVCGDYTFVAAIIQVDEVLLVFGWKSCGINGISMVLTGDMALASCQVQRWDVVGTVSILELDGSGTSCKSKQLMAKTDTHDWDLGRLH